jgi:hypothetical protein
MYGYTPGRILLDDRGMSLALHLNYKLQHLPSSPSSAGGFEI